MKKEKIKAVIFDVGGVLDIPKNPKKDKEGKIVSGVHEEMAKKFNMGIDQWFDSLDTSYSDAIEGLISKEKVLSIISKNLKTTPKKLEELFIKTYRKKNKPNNELYKIAFKLKKQGYKIAILSDQWYVSKEALVLEKYTKKFNTVVISCDVGMRKPNSKIYKLILKKLKLKPQETIFIDNREWNLKPADKLGMKTILFKDNKQVIKQLKKFKIYCE